MSLQSQIQIAGSEPTAIARPDLPRPSVIFDEMEILRRKWHLARVGRDLPPYEEIAVGSLGTMADYLALVTDHGSGAGLSRMGRLFASWLERPGLTQTPVADLSRHRREVLEDLVARARRTGKPVEGLAHEVHERALCSYELLALPIAPRRGVALTLFYIREQSERHSLLDALFEATEAGFLALTAVRNGDGDAHDFRIIALNDGASRLLRRGREELLHGRVSELFAPFMANGSLDGLFSVLHGSSVEQFEVGFERREGGTGCLGIRAAAMGELVALTIVDISEIKAREASFKLLFDVNPVPMFLHCAQSSDILAANDAAVEHYGYSRQTLRGLSMSDLAGALPEGSAQDFVEGGGTICRHVRADGAEIEVLSYRRSMIHANRPAVLSAFVDVTERRAAEMRIAHMAHHDALTGLPNRTLFRERLESELSRVKRGQELAVLCIDLDHFKDVNDTLGHPIGDLLLQAVAERVTCALRETDFVARLGGDEFAVVQTMVEDPRHVGALADRLVEKISEPYELDGHQVTVGASIGIALAPQDAREADTLLKSADMALYRAKADGRRTFCYFEPEMDARLQERRALELDLRHALLREEFELYYQPLVKLDTQNICGFEALLRWHHPERGMVSPADFIPIAEETGLIVPIGAWVLRRACEDAALWPANIRIAVNLSPVQFRARGLVEAVISALSNSGLDARRLELEITESVLLTENDANLAILHQLRDLGVAISMDDFGTGYSSLSYLRSFPFDKIKIDRSFVRDLGERSDCAAIVRAVANLGESLGIVTTVEGIETREQLDQVLAEGCGEGQGFYISAPVPIGETRLLLDQRRTD